MKIIGGEFAIEPQKYFESNELLYQRTMFSSGRAALYAILNDITMKSPDSAGGVLLPDFLCGSITNIIIESGWKYSFYNIDSYLYPIEDSIDIKLKQNYKVVLLINYFGLIDLSKTIERIHQIMPKAIIIMDNVQAYYEMEDKTTVDYQFTSYRKWFPCPDGANVIKRDGSELADLNMERNIFAQYKFAGNLLKSFSPDISDEIALSLISKGESLLNENYLCQCSDFSRKLIPCIDFKEISEIRKHNAKVLHTELTRLGIKHLYKEECTPFFIPIFIANRDLVRKAFFANSIYTPIHWPYIDRQINVINTLYANELSLICDQRYDTEDMQRQIEILTKAVN